jgi:Flp pilus assembly protein TadG
VRRRPCHHGGEQGVTTTEVVIVMPAVMLLVMFVLQFALYYHAANVATGAAQDAVRAARVEHGSAGAGGTRAREVVGRSAGGALDDPTVTVSRDGGTHTVRAEVSGDVPSLIPGLRLSVTRVAEGPTEEFLPPEQR